MAIGRKKNDATSTGMPPEVQDYYTAERRQRTGVMWLLVIGTIIVTVLLAAVLYFGGRWVYRTAFQKQSKSTTTSIDQGEDKKDGQTSSTKTNEPSPNPSSNSSNTSNNSGSTNTGTTAETNNTSGASSGSSSTGSTSGATKVATPATTPDTGPGDVLAIAIGAAVVAAAGYQVYMRRKFANQR